MSFIDGQQADPDIQIGQFAAQPGESFGGNVQQANGPGTGAIQHLALGGGGKRGIQKGCGQSPAPCRGDLILHQGDEGTHHDGQPGEDQRRDLEQIDLPAPVGSTARASRPARTAAMTFFWEGRKSG